MRTLVWIRILLVVVIVGLVASGVTAFPLEAELRVASDVLHAGWLPAPEGFTTWVDRVHAALVGAYGAHPFLAYGTDWLAFAHLMIAVAFVGPLRDPVRNVWVIRWGLIMCAATLPMILIAGGTRGIPWGWQVIDASFGVLAAVPLIAVLVLTRRLAALSTRRNAGDPVPATALARRGVGGSATHPAFLETADAAPAARGSARGA